MTTRPIEAVLDEHTSALMALPGVVGIGIGGRDAERWINVYVARTSADLRRRLPTTLDGHPVKVQETGELRALDPGA